MRAPPAIKCYNGHSIDTPACIGCHHRFHVLEQGKVEGGRIVPPVVDGPESCDLCHDARHHVPVRTCPRCAYSILDAVLVAEKSAAPIRQEIMLLRLEHWALGWPTTILGWIATLLGGNAVGWFGTDNPNDSFKALALFVAIPFFQWILRLEIKRRRRLIPRIGPGGEITYGGEETEDSI